MIAAGPFARVPELWPKSWPAWTRKAALGLVVLLLAAAAAVVRLVDLNNQPGGLYPDEAAEGVTALGILHTPGYHPIFVAEDGGREALYAYFVAFAFRFFGATIEVLRGTSAVFGVGCVVLMYFAIRRYGTAAGLAAAAWCAGSLWMIAVSRDGMRNMITPFVGALAVLAMLRLMEAPTKWRALCAGAVIGLGFWTYQPLKFLPVVLIVWLIWCRKRQPETFAPIWRQRAWLVGSFLVVVLPMAIFAALHPVEYLGRAVGTTITSGSWPAHIVQTLAQFAFTGDPNTRHDVNAAPLLPAPLVPLFFIGLVACWRRRRNPLANLMIVGLVVMLLPPLAAIEGGSPHFLRNLGLAPYVAGLVGVGAASTLSFISQRRRLMIPATAALTLCFVGVGAGAANSYFSRPVADRYNAYSFDVLALANAVDRPNALVVMDDYDAMDVQFVDWGKNVTLNTDGHFMADLSPYSEVLAQSRKNLSLAVGPDIANAAVPVAWDLNGNAVAYRAYLPSGTQH